MTVIRSSQDLLPHVTVRENGTGNPTTHIRGESQARFAGDSVVIHGQDDFRESPYLKGTNGQAARDVKTPELYLSKFGKAVEPSAGRALRHVGVAGAIVAASAAAGTVVGLLAYYLSGKKKKLFEVAAAVTTFFIALPHLGNVFNVKSALSKMYLTGANDFTKDLSTKNMRQAQRAFKKRYPDMARYLREAVKYGNNDHINAAHNKGADALAEMLFAEKRLVVDKVVQRPDDARVLHAIVTGYRSYDEPSLSRAWQSLRLGWTSWGAGALLPAEQAQGAGRLIPYNSIAALAGGAVLAAAAVQQSNQKTAVTAKTASPQATPASNPTAAAAPTAPMPNTTQGVAYTSSPRYAMYNSGQSTSMGVTG